MPMLSLVAFLFQDTSSLASDVHSLMIAEWIIVIFICIVLAVLAVVGVIVLRIVKKAQKTVETVQGKAMPLIGQGQEIALKVQEIIAELQPKIASISSDVQRTVADIQPKVVSISGDIERMSAMVREKAEEAGSTFTRVNETVQDVNGKTKQQVQRVNGMVSDALSTTEQVSKQIQHGIKVPVQKIAEWVAAAKLGIENLSERLPFLNHDAPAPRATNTYTTPTHSTGTVAPGGPPFVPAPTRIRE